MKVVRGSNNTTHHFLFSPPSQFTQLIGKISTTRLWSLSDAWRPGQNQRISRSKAATFGGVRGCFEDGTGANALKCFFAVRVDKRHLPDGIASDAELYRVAFWRLLEELEIELTDLAESGIVLFDSLSDLHSSVQDRRMVDAFREWASLRSKPTRLVELPWFGFSEFYSGLQLADFCAYLVDFISNEVSRPARAEELHGAFSAIAQKLKLVDVP